MTKEELQKYEPKGDLKDFPKEIIARMLHYQEEQSNKRDVTVFEEDKFSFLGVDGFDWDKTKEKFEFWNEVITEKDFDLFFEKYPKQDNQDNSQEFKVGDKVYDIIYGEIGVIKRINIDDTYSIHVSFNDNTYDEYLINGVCRQNHKIPQLLHYRDDYNYDVIDFNNLPKRQEPKRWRAEKEGVYYFVSFDNECWFFSDDTKDDYDHFDNDNYNSGNYFSTEVEAEIIAQKMNTYFKQLIQEEHVNELGKIRGTDNMSNLMPACPSCNHYKSTFNLEEFREQLMLLRERLNKQHKIYCISKRYRLIEEKPNKIVFFFEKPKLTCYLGEDMTR